MTEALASKTCTPCRGGKPPLTRELSGVPNQRPFLGQERETFAPVECFSVWTQSRHLRVLLYVRRALVTSLVESASNR
jgi:hypothetical protein